MAATGKLQPQQVEASLWVQARKKCILADDMRMGKTRAAGHAFLARDLLPLLIVCPSSAKLVWRDELLELNPDLRIEVAKGRTFRFSKGVQVMIMNYDLLSFVKPRRPKGVIADEAHRLKSPDARRSQYGIRLLQKVPYACAVSGTPMPSRPIELWPVLFGLGITRLVWEPFAFEFANAYRDEYGAVIARGASNLDKLRELIAPHILHRKKETRLTGYQQPIRKIITFDRPPEAWESEYNKEELFNHSNPSLAFESLSELLKLSALKKVADCVEFIKGLLEAGIDPDGDGTLGEKICVFAYHHEVISILQEELADYNPVILTGKSSSKQREAAKQAFREDPTCRVFIGNILAAGEAIDLSTADVSVFVETTWVPKDIDQAINRTESMFKLGRASMAYFLTTEASLDHYMLKRLIEKAQVIEQVIVPTTPEQMLQPFDKEAIMAKSEKEIKLETIMETLNDQDALGLLKMLVATQIRIAESIERSEQSYERCLGIYAEGQKAAAVKVKADKPISVPEISVEVQGAKEETKPEETKAEARKDAKQEDIRTLMATYAKANGAKGRDMAIAELEKCTGAGRVADIPADQLNAARDHFEALLA